MLNGKTLRLNTTGWLAIAFYAVAGLLLLIWPDFALNIANYALAALLCIIGTVMIITYIRSTPFDGVMGFSLSLGMILLLVGIVLFINNELLVALLPFFWGVAMIAGGFGKVQMAFDLKRMQDSRWWIMLIGALVSFVLGVFSATRPIFIATVATQFAGISLLVESVLDAVALIAIRKRIREAFPKELFEDGAVK